MTDQPPGPPPEPSYVQPGYTAPPPKPRPTSVTVLSIIGIIFGTLGTLGGFCGFAQLLITPETAELIPMAKALGEHGFLRLYHPVSMMINWVLSGVLLAGSIGSVSLKPWAWSAMLRYAWASVLVGVIATVVLLVVVVPVILPFMDSSDPSEQAAAWGAIRRNLMGIVVALVYALAVLVVYRKPRVVEAFAGSGPPSPARA